MSLYAATAPRRASSPRGASQLTVVRSCSTWRSAIKSRRPSGLAFLRDMVSRGLKIPTSVTCDGAPGLLNAVAKVFSRSLRAARDVRYRTGGP
jgi:hypothetical protein